MARCSLGLLRKATESGLIRPPFHIASPTKHFASHLINLDRDLLDLQGFLDFQSFPLQSPFFNLSPFNLDRDLLDLQDFLDFQSFPLQS